MNQERFTRFDWYSLSTVPIKMYFNDKLNDTFVSSGTAFFWRLEDRDYLVTAWHNFSGRHFETKKHLSSGCTEPNLIEVYWNLRGQPVGRKTSSRIRLRNDDEDPLWFVDRDKKSDIDIAVLPVSAPVNVELHHINHLRSSNIELAVGCEMFILGYPLGIEGVGLPIWKRGSLASEWQIPEEVQPFWLVDTASNAGMSGAPVIQRTYFPDPIEEDFIRAGIKKPQIPLFGDYGNNGRSKFLGIYTGRKPGVDGKDLQLGIVWPGRLVENIIEQRFRDKPEYWRK